MFQIEWCTWQGGVDESDQDWHVAIPNAGVDTASQAACEREAALLSDESEGRYLYRVVAATAAPALPLRTVVSRWDVGAEKWVQFQLEVKAS